MSQNDVEKTIIQIKIGETEMNTKSLGIDIAKNTSQLHGVDTQGKCVLQKKVTRIKLISFIAQLPKCKIGMESCSGSNY